MWTREELSALPEELVQLFEKLERGTVDRICARLNKIGELSPASAHELTMLARIGGDVDAIEREIARTVGASEDAVRKLYTQAAERDYEFQRGVFDKLGTAWVPFAENAAVQSLIADATKVTLGEIRNLTRTTGFTNRAGEWQKLAAAYQDTIDYAVLQVRTGATDFHMAMRGAVKQLSDNGLSAIEYDNEGKRYYRRRLDSSVRNAFMGGQQRLSRAQAQSLGEKFGADGMEVSAHSGSRESHLWFQGGQFPILEFQRDVEPQLNDYNCYHRAFPIILGISPPAYTQAERDAMTRDAHTTFEFEGKTYTPYEARQMQRRFETAMRREKDRAVAFKASGDTAAERIAKGKTTALGQKYKQFSNAAGLPSKANRAVVAGYTRGAGIKSLTNAAGSDIIRVGGGKLTTGASGAIPRTDVARLNEHAERYYDEIRKRTSDISAIAKNTGFAVADVEKIKQHVFFNEYVLDGGGPRRFDPNYDMAVSWQRLIEGKDIREMDVVLLNHERLEYTLMTERHLTYAEAHVLAEREYNYTKFVANLDKEAGLK